MDRIASVSDFATADRIKVELGSEVFLVFEHAGDYYAIENRCPHLGMSMARARIEEDTIVCPWHGSRFSICTGENLDWVNAFAGIPMPRWSHRLIGLGRKPGPIRSVKLNREGDSLLWPEAAPEA